MAKEKFVRSKPHVNVGTIGHTQTLQDTAVNLLVDDSGSDTEGNLAPSSVLTFSAPASSGFETATVAFPIDTDFVFDPNSSGPAVSIDFQFDVLTSISGTPEIDVTLAIVQSGKSFIASHAGGSPSVDNSTAAWATVGQTGLLPEEFSEVGGGPDRVDFGLPFQFGYAFTGHYSTTALGVELGLDNMQVEITTIPEPTTIALPLPWERHCCGTAGGTTPFVPTQTRISKVKSCGGRSSATSTRPREPSWPPSPFAPHGIRYA